MIALAFLLVRSALTVEQLEALTGLHNDTVRSAVKGLASKGLLFKQVGERGRQTWLPAGDTLFSRLAFQNPKTSDSALNVVDVVESKMPLLSDSTTTTTNNQNPKTSDSGLRGEEISNLAALKEAGIVGKKARALAVLPWVTPEYIRAHAEAVRGEFWDNPQGMMIYRIEGEVEAPEIEPTKVYKRVSLDLGKRGKEEIVYTFDVDGEAAAFTGHERGCRCMDCHIHRSRGGDWLCPTCKHFNCECEREESEEP